MDDPADVRVLHVDDEPGFAEVVARMLVRQNDRFAVETASSAGEGLDRLAEDTYDCIVSDYDMPRRNGIEFLETVRDEYPDLPFILYTGKGSEDVASDAISAGATDYLQKASGTEQYELLANRIRNAVEQFRNTQRRATLERIRTLVNDVNGTLVRAPSRERIETEVCDTLADSDPYRFAVVAGVDPETKQVRPRAWGGTGEGFLDEFEMSVAENDAGRRAPGGRAFHEREIAVAQDIRTDPSYEPWRDLALAHDFEALAVIPLEYETDLFGLLAVFADRPRAFDETERELLGELSDDIAHAIHAREVKAHLHDERALVEQALDTLDDVFYIVDADGTLLRWNRRLPDVLGYTDEDLVGTGVTDIVPDDERETVAGAIERTLTTGDVTVESELLTADGERIPYELTGSRLTDADDELIGLIGIGRDITDRRARERERELQYEAIFNRTYQFIGLMDPDGTLLEANRTALEFGGLDREDVVGKPFWEAYWWQHDAETRRELREAIDRAGDGEFVRYEVEVRGEDRNATIDFSVRPVTNEDGEVEYLIPEGRDITELRALQRRERELERQNERLDRFVGVVSHDLRNPLYTAQGRLELARGECDSEHLAGAADAVDRGVALIEDLLALARHGEPVGEVEPVSLPGTVDDCWRTVETGDARLVARTGRTVRADPGALKQLLENLFRNAVEHGDEAVTVTVGDLDGGFYVADDGPGIPEGEREQVFEAGYSTADGGPGLGLSIVHEIVEAHGWNVRIAESETGGTRFELTGVDILGG